MCLWKGIRKGWVKRGNRDRKLLTHHVNKGLRFLIYKRALSGRNAYGEVGLVQMQGRWEEPSLILGQNTETLGLSENGLREVVLSKKRIEGSSP